MSSVDELAYVGKKSRAYLNTRQAIAYNDHREDILTWLSEEYENSAGEELSELTVENYAYRLDRFYRFVWDQLGEYTIQISHEHADAYVEMLADDELTKRTGEPYSNEHKRKEVNALTKLFDWHAETRNGQLWDHDHSFPNEEYNRSDIFELSEWRTLRESVLSYGSIPSYKGLSPTERDRWKGYLAQKLGKKKREVSPSDWDEVNMSWKITSLVWTAMDAGLRPCEITRAKLHWLRLDKQTLFIPKEESSKNRDNWEIALQPETADALRRWTRQRQNQTKYDDSEHIWLNRKGNPYNSGTLNYLLDNLLENAGIAQQNRKLTWYSIRRSLATHIVDKGDLSQAKAQLRHKRLETTIGYVESTTESRRDILAQLG